MLILFYWLVCRWPEGNETSPRVLIWYFVLFLRGTRILVEKKYLNCSTCKKQVCIHGDSCLYDKSLVKPRGGRHKIRKRIEELHLAAAGHPPEWYIVLQLRKGGRIITDATAALVIYGECTWELAATTRNCVITKVILSAGYFKIYISQKVVGRNSKSKGNLIWVSHRVNLYWILHFLYEFPCCSFNSLEIGIWIFEGKAVAE